jgi:hypothetical protein
VLYDCASTYLTFSEFLPKGNVRYKKGNFKHGVANYLQIIGGRDKHFKAEILEKTKFSNSCFCSCSEFIEKARISLDTSEEKAMYKLFIIMVIRPTGATTAKVPSKKRRKFGTQMCTYFLVPK